MQILFDNWTGRYDDECLMPGDIVEAAMVYNFRENAGDQTDTMIQMSEVADIVGNLPIYDTIYKENRYSPWKYAGQCYPGELQNRNPALIKTVEEWGKERGMTHIAGPLGFTDFDAEGMLVEGFDQLSTMATIYNYPYYPVHMEKLGFEKDADWVEYKIYIPDAIPDKHKRISELIQRKYNLKIKKYTSGRKIAKDYGQKIFELMNEAYSPLYGYSPLTQRQIDQYVKMYLPILDLRMVTLITDANDELVCVGISMPSLAEALQKSNGRLLPLGWFYLLKALFMKRRAKMLDLLLVAVKPEYQNKGVNALLFSDLIPVYQKLGFIFAESNPELELNGKVQAQWDYFETQQHKRRRAFIKEIK